MTDLAEIWKRHWSAEHVALDKMQLRAEKAETTLALEREQNAYLLDLSEKQYRRTEADRQRAEAEVARLRAALEDIDGLLTVDCPPRMVEIVRKALATVEK